MKYSINIANFFALAPGLQNTIQWQQWARQTEHDWSLPLPKCQRIPMMAARRMSAASRLAVEVGLELLADSPDHIVITSRHGELEPTFRILTDLNQAKDISPTDFTMSVHNTAAGLLTITAGCTLPVSSIAAGIDSFQQGIIEALAILHDGAKHVLVIDMDGAIPACYQHKVDQPAFPYAAGFIISLGNQFNCKMIETTDIPAQLPQSLSLLKAILSDYFPCTIRGNPFHWQWSE